MQYKYTGKTKAFFPILGYEVYPDEIIYSDKQINHPFIVEAKSAKKKSKKNKRK